MKKGYIYKITSPSGRIYVGQTISLRLRLNKYRRNNCKGQKRLYDSLVKYTWDSHIFEIIEEINVDNCTDNYNNDILNEKEIYWIKELNSYYNGLNMTEGGRVIITTLESRKKISESLKGEKNYMYGKYHSDETKSKMSKSHGETTGEKRSKMVEINNIMYNSINEASKSLKIPRTTLLMRCRSTNNKFDKYIIKDTI